MISEPFSNNEELDSAKNDLEFLKNLLGEKERNTDKKIKFLNQLIVKKQKELNGKKKKISKRKIFKRYIL